MEEPSLSWKKGGALICIIGYLYGAALNEIIDSCGIEWYYSNEISIDSSSSILENAL
jgi:hypothetical protein